MYVRNARSTFILYFTCPSVNLTLLVVHFLRPESGFKASSSVFYVSEGESEASGSVFYAYGSRFDASCILCVWEWI